MIRLTLWGVGITGLFLTWSGQAQSIFPDLGPLKVTGNERLRYESRQNYDFIYDRPSVDGMADNDDNFLLHRLRINLDYKPADWFLAHVTLQDAREFGSHQIDHDSLDDRYANQFENQTDVHEAYVKLKLGACPLWLQAGRQQLNYGDQRLIGGFNWANNARSFDAIKLRYEKGDASLDLFAANVVRVDSNAWDNKDHEDDFLGAYGSVKNLPLGTHDLYLLYRGNDESDIGIYTLGTRVDGKKGPLDWNFEGAYQWGTSVDRVALFQNDQEILDHNAWAIHGEMGWTLASAPCKPRLALEYNFASGDKDPNDGENNTFENLYPTNHLFYGYMDFFAWKNIHNPALKLSWKPCEKLSLKTHWHFFWLDEAQTDAWYNAGGSVLRNARGDSVSSYVGQELDFVATYQAAKNWELELGYSHFFAGDYVKDTAPAGTDEDDADFVYVQSVWSF